MPATRSPLTVNHFESKTEEVNGVTLHYWIGGNAGGNPVLLWHGFLGTAYSWHKVMPLLAEAGYAVLVPDMRGYGDSDKPAGDVGYDGRALAEEFRTLVRQIGFGKGKPLFLAAHDMGAPPALLWAADHPEEVSGLVYMECPVMLDELLSEIIVFKPKQMEKGSMWWWILPLAPGVPERLIVGREREFLTWFYQGATEDPGSIDEDAIQETLRTFAGVEGVLGSMGVYRTAFTTMKQTGQLLHNKVKVPVLAIGGEKGLGSKVEQMVKSVAADLTGTTISSCGHFVPEEQPQEFVRLLEEFASKLVMA
jgi:pimeloyl-ACP methyl ester carboxylesterase